MKIVAISDSHGMHRRVSIPKADVLIHCGDVTGHGEWREVEGFIEWLKEHSTISMKEFNKFKILDDKTIDQYDQDNQTLREMLDKQFEAIQEEGDKILLKEGIDLMRSMHQRRKVSDLIGLLQQQEG